MADNLKEIFEEAGEFAEANNNKLTLADAVVLIAEAYELGLNIVNEIVEYFSRFPFVVDDISSGWQYMRAIGHPEVEDSVSFSPLTLNDSDWCIAAPYDR